MTDDKKCPQCNFRDKAPRKSVCNTCATRNWRAQNPRLAAYFNVKRSAQKRGELFNLTFEDFWEKIKFTKYMQRKGRGADDLQIDRIREDEGYTKDNIQVIKMHKNVEKYHKWHKNESAHAKHSQDLMAGCPF